MLNFLSPKGEQKSGQPKIDFRCVKIAFLAFSGFCDAAWYIEVLTKLKIDKVILFWKKYMNRKMNKNHNIRLALYFALC